MYAEVKYVFTLYTYDKKISISHSWCNVNFYNNEKCWNIYTIFCFLFLSFHVGERWIISGFNIMRLKIINRNKLLSRLISNIFLLCVYHLIPHKQYGLMPGRSTHNMKRQVRTINQRIFMWRLKLSKRSFNL